MRLRLVNCNLHDPVWKQRDEAEGRSQGEQAPEDGGVVDTEAGQDESDFSR